MTRMISKPPTFKRRRNLESLTLQSTATEVASKKRGPNPSHATVGSTNVAFLPNMSSGSFQFCIALIELQQAHSRLLGALEHARELQRRGLIYREAIHTNRQFVDAYLAHHQKKIDRTLDEIQECRKQAIALMASSREPSSPETASSVRFSARFQEARSSGSPRVPDQLGRVRFQASIQ